MKAPRGLTAEEAALWRRVTATVVPLAGKETPCEAEAAAVPAAEGGAPRPAPAAARPAVGRAVLQRNDRGRTAPLSQGRGLDSSWERKLSRAAIAPDFTLDLHGHTLEQAHRRLDMGLGQAKAMGARLVLLIVGKSRQTEAADRGERRGAIRATVLDWLAAGPHAGDIAAIRKAHRRHGGEGALYLVLKRKR